jgi:hypothetical protein
LKKLEEMGLKAAVTGGGQEDRLPIVVSSVGNGAALASAELGLKITRRAKEGATKAGLPDAVAQFQDTEAYCNQAAQCLRGELDSTEPARKMSRKARKRLVSRDCSRSYGLVTQTTSY